MKVAQTIKKNKPNRLNMSYGDYLAFAGESEIVEWVEGEIITYMPPVDKHQEISIFLSELLHAFVRFFNLGILRYAPLEVKLWPDGPSREPDIFFVLEENKVQLRQKRFEGAPDLIIEIVSPSSVTADRVRKFTEYEKAGVKEYWIIDPRPHQLHGDFYVLNKEGMYEAKSVNEDGIYYSTIIPNFWLKLNWLWENPLPNPQLALAEVMMSLKEVKDEVRTTYAALHKLLTS